MNENMRIYEKLINAVTTTAPQQWSSCCVIKEFPLDEEQMKSQEKVVRLDLILHYHTKFRGLQDNWTFLKKVSSAHQDCINLITNKNIITVQIKCSIWIYLYLIMSKLNFQHHYPSTKKCRLNILCDFYFQANVSCFKGVHFCW